jgi:glycosyltransferase involved in cell wall biosynthesis
VSAQRDTVKVSLVATVKDARAHIERFLQSIREQTRQPDEIVIVDGGSTDGTVEVLRKAESVTLIEEPGANIARGRNVAIGAATHDVIAVSDADCTLSPQWLERLLEPIERGAQVSMGAYRARPEGLFQACAAAVAVPLPDEIREETFMPSSRSVAFRRETYILADGYPEFLDRGEDMYLDLRWRELGVRMKLAPDAVAYWPPRDTLREHWRQYAGYARHDAIGGMYPRRHAIRFAVYGGAVVTLARRRPRLLALGAIAGAAYVARPLRRALRMLSDPADRAASVALVPALMAVTDTAKMAGYLSGFIRRKWGALTGE